MERKHRSDKETAYISFEYFSGLTDPEGIECQRCNLGTGRHSCWRSTWEEGSPDLRLDVSTIRRFS